MEDLSKVPSMRPFPPWLARFENQDLEIHEAPNGHVFVKDLTLVPVKNITEVRAESGRGCWH